MKFLYLILFTCWINIAWAKSNHKLKASHITMLYDFSDIENFDKDVLPPYVNSFPIKVDDNTDTYFVFYDKESSYRKGITHDNLIKTNNKITSRFTIILYFELKF